ncbi:hypothetical protein [Bombilactobacillus thymidiniphilus]|uniref:Surface layer protein A domain-containing protein n=1 Tax=Bombilactobacillus thymidiniphilus TaxID=2923363 RepID=A0ABY4PB82_9LACO|nr:hypothetical protein [Bombilactobacillus thymidiniphilus]UQS83015.1 hypothetical protein MOO47_04325 [Bombilactobacillus thymidiniphilus]
MKKLRNLMVIVFLLIPTFIETIIIPNNNVVQAKVRKHKSKTRKAKPVKKIEIGQVYLDVYSSSCIKLLDQDNYALLDFNDRPKPYFDDGELYMLEFNMGKYTKKGDQYIFHMETNQFTRISFMDMKRWKAKQYSYSDGPAADYTSPNDTSHSMIMYPKKGRYYVKSYFKGKRYMGTDKLEYYSNSIKGVKHSTFPNNAQEFLQQFTYISEKEVNKLYLKGK